jgi:hypothetical protein
VHKILFRIERTSFKLLFILFSVVVFIFAFIYISLPAEYGELKFSYDPKAKVEFWDCLYFSVVTISSLGFGDYYPLGWMRLFVGFEVFLGLIFLGTLVAKIASEKSAYYLKRLYSGQVHDRIVGFGDGLIKWFDQYKSVIDKEEISEQLFGNKNENLYEDLLSLSISMRKYIGYEVYFGEFFFDISKSSLHSPLDQIQEILNYLNKNISDSLVVTNANKRRISKTAKMYITISNTIIKHSKTQSLHKKCKEIIRGSEKLRKRVDDLQTEK